MPLGDRDTAPRATTALYRCHISLKHRSQTLIASPVVLICSATSRISPQRLHGPVSYLGAMSSDLTVPTLPVVSEQHVEVAVEAPDGSTVMIDEGIAAVIQFVWGLGCETLFSCEGNADSPATIGFYTADEMERAFAALDGLCRRQGGGVSSGTDGDHFGLWWHARAWPRIWYAARRDSPWRPEPPGLMYYQLAIPPADVDRLRRVLVVGGAQS
jgi:hypothetical protein